MTIQDCKKFRDAAYDWAWNKGWKVRVNRIKVGDGLWESTCTLIAKHRIREYT